MKSNKTVNQIAAEILLWIEGTKNGSGDFILNSYKDLKAAKSAASRIFDRNTNIRIYLPLRKGSVTVKNSNFLVTAKIGGQWTI
jgi:hypothetical protein